MKIDIMTLFPEMCETVLSESVVGRARRDRLIEVSCTNIRDYTTDKHGRVDDAPYGGWNGMVLQAQPIYDCYQALCKPAGKPLPLIYLSPQGKTLTQQKVKELAAMEHLVLLCGHYEGVDERVLEEIVTEEISIGDYVLTGGELPALVLVDAVSRMMEGVLASEEAYQEESHYNGLLEYPQYTRPRVWRDREVPEVLLSGHRANIVSWRRQKALERTLERRPDMLQKEGAASQISPQVFDLKRKG